MSGEKCFPRDSEVLRWHRTALEAAPIFRSFFATKLNRSVPLGDEFVATHSDGCNTYSLTRFNEDGAVHHLSFKVPERVGSLDLWDCQKKSAVCSYATVARLGVSLNVIVDELQGACIAMSKQVRPKDGVVLPQSFYSILGH